MSKNSEWKKVNFSDAVSINPRESLKKGTLAKKVAMSNITEHTKKIYSYDIEEYKSGPKFRQGDTLFARITPSLENGKTSKVNILEEDELGFGSTELIVMREKSGMTDGDFIYYLTRWDGIRGPAIKSMTGTSGRQRVQNSIFDDLLIELPPLEEQKLIANILSSFDDKIENNNAIIANLEEQAQTIFKSWFVDFEPFQEEEFVESEVGNIPKSFVVKKLEDISTIQNGYAFKSNDYIEKGIKVIRTLNIENNFLNESNYVYLPSEFHTDNSHLKHKLNLYDTLIVMVGSTIGKSGMILSNDLPSLQNQNMWRFRALDKKISPFYINYIVKKINEEVSGWTSGSAREFYRKDVFGKQKIAVPSLVVMERFNKLTQTLFAQIDILKQENNLLAKTRDILLPKLMSGEIRVEDTIEVKEM